MAQRISRAMVLAVAWTCLMATSSLAQSTDGGLDDQPPAETQPRPARRARAREAPRESAWPAEPAPAPVDENGWRTAERTAPAEGSARGGGGDQPLEPLRELPESGRRSIAKVKQGTDTLPNEHGQVWREYDITPYTLRVASTTRPEQAIVDWIFRETGFEVWHSEKVSVLAADGRSLRVYHTPEVQAVVGDIVDRFVNTDAETQAFSVRVVTIDHPSWRTKVQRLLKPVPVQTPGVQAWLVTREDAAFMLAELRRRSDFREHGSPHLLVNNGQSTVVSNIRPRTYVRDLALRPEAWPGFQAEMTQYDEGFSLEFSPLLSSDGTLVDAAIKCNIDQVERLMPVSLEIPVPAAQRQRTQVDVLQSSQFRLHERFRWPADHVLIVGLGVVPTPVAREASGLTMGLTSFLGPARADMLLVLESKGKMAAPQTPAAATARTAPIPATTFQR
ncbi:MAG: hypothetical protein AB7U73_13205 [Pirellulales bacterium]